MIVIADTTPINYLILIDEIEILSKLYGQIVISNAVFEELKAKATPPKVKTWLENLPKWLEVKSISSEIDKELIRILDAGESEAIQLAKELKADLLIIDEKLGPETAVKNGLRIIGTIGVLALAGKRNLVDIENVLEKLEQTNFHISETLKKSLRKSKK